MDYRGANPVAIINVGGAGDIGNPCSGYGFTNVFRLDPTGSYMVYVPGISIENNIAVVSCMAAVLPVAWSIPADGQLFIDSRPNGIFPFSAVVYRIPNGGNILVEA